MTSAGCAASEFAFVGVGGGGGNAESSGLDVSTNPTSGKVLGFSMDGSEIAPGCGVLTELDITGTPTGIVDIVVADPDGVDLGFSYDSNQYLLS